MRFLRETGLNRFARLASIALLSIVLALVQRPTSSAEPDYHPEFNLARGWITSATFSRDGKRLLTGSFGNLAQTWDVKTGQELRRFQGHLAQVHNTVFSPDGKQVLAVAGRIDAYLSTGFPNDCTARLWDVATGKETRCFKGHTRYVHTGLFSPDGKRILTVSRDSTARLWDAGTGKQLFVFLNVNAGHYAAVFDSDGGKILGRLAGGRKIQLWDAKTGKQLCVVEYELTQ